MRVFDAGARDGPQGVHRRVLTVPNALSLVRLVALPWLFADILAGHHLRALLVAAAIAATDWLDGYVARRFDQVSRLGQLLDPLVDRLLVATLAVGMVLAEVVPLWAVVVVLARDALLLAGAGAVLACRAPVPPVTRTGKAATFVLMVALPAFLLGSALQGAGSGVLAEVVRFGAWAGYLVGVALYYAAGATYARASIRAVRARRPGSRADRRVG